MAKKIPVGLLLITGWILVALFTYLAFFTRGSTWISNLASDAFGAALSIVLIGTITAIVLKLKKVF